MLVLEPVPGTDVYLWKYIPSIPGSIVFIFLFLITGLLISFRMYKTKTWFSSAFVIGCFLEVIGYIFRAVNASMTSSIAIYATQASFILVPPALFAASIYMCLSRLIRLVDGNKFSIIRPELITKIFVTCDYLSFMIQGNAAGLTSKEKLRTIATALILVGLAIQLVSFGLFGVCAAVFHQRFRRTQKNIDKAWSRSLYMLYAVSVLVMIRSLFRIVEYALGMNGYPMTHEWTLFAFDSAPMMLVTIIYFVEYPSLLASGTMGGNEAIQLQSRAGSSE